MDNRSLSIRRALLKVLRNLPDGILLPEELLRIEAARLVVPRPTTSELVEQVLEADVAHQIIGIPTDEGTKWKLAQAGRAWLAEHQ